MKTSKQKILWQGMLGEQWIKSAHKYGLAKYHRILIDYISSLKTTVTSNLVLDIGVGNGFPFASSLSEKGFQVAGVDISENLVEECRQNYPKIDAQVADAEALPYENDKYSIVYCFQSSWCMPAIEKVINEMVRVTAKDGYVLFDIMNALNPRMFYLYIKNRTFGVLLRLGVNLKRVMERKGRPLIYVFSYPEIIRTRWQIENILKKVRGISYEVATANDPSLSGLPLNDYFNSRILFKINKVR
jgi:SAM-dependent methyltransferase